MMNCQEYFPIIECVLFVSGEPLAISQLQRALKLTSLEMAAVIDAMSRDYRDNKRGVQLYATKETIQLVTNPQYAQYVQELLEPPQKKSFSQAMLETLSIIAYRQPVTRADIEAVRGVRCDYSVRELLRQGLIQELGRRDCIGKPMQFGTTDTFLRQFGLRAVEELPSYEHYSSADTAQNPCSEDLPAV